MEPAMARRRRDSFLTDVLTIASKLPWKISLMAAVVSMALLHLVAVTTAPIATARSMADMGPVMVHQMIHTFAFLFQFVIPPALVIGAAVSYFKQRRSVMLFKEVRTGSGRDVGSLDWQQFEILVAEGFRHQGFSVFEKGGSAPDGGVDLVLSRGRDKYLVQCKQWRAQQVGVTIVRELYGVMTAERAAGGYVVTSGRFTADAKKFAAGRNIELIDGGRLPSLLRDPVAGSAPKAGRSVAAELTSNRAPQCPNCQTPMVVRVAKQGPNAGDSFWGCGRYPKCRGTLPKAA
jgi:restriction system protein